MKKIIAGAILAVGGTLISISTAHAAVTLSKDFNAAPLNQGIFSTTCVTSQDPLDPTNNVGYLSNEFSTDGGMSFKAQVRKTDPICGNSHRTEMHLSTTNPIMQNAEWIAWDTYQDVNQPNDPVPYVTGQLHGSVIVPFGLWFFDGIHVWATIQSRVDGVNMVQTKYDLGNIGTKGVWHKWILHFKRATDNTGLVELWADGVKKFTFNGPTMDLNETQFYFKFGIYKWSILNSIYDSATTYTDNLKFGDSTSTISDFLVVPDTTVPTGTLTAPLSGAALNGTTTLTATASDNVGVASVNFFYGTTLISSDTTAPYTASWNTNLVANGAYQVKAIISDTSGNTNSTQIVNVTVNNPDVTVPTVSLTAPAANAIVSSTATITATASDNVGVVGVDFYYGTTLIGTDSAAPYTAFWNTTAVANGPYTLKAIARDAAGNTATSISVPVNVANPDNTPPTGTLTAPLSGAALNGTITLTATASDNVGVASVNFFYGTTPISIDTTAPYTATWNTALVPDGVYVLKGIIVDTTGNTNSTQLVSVTVSNPDTTAPVVSITSPSNGSAVSGTPAIVVNATDNVGVASVDFYYGTTIIATDTTAPYFVAWDTRSVANGIYVLKAIARDAAGNSTTSALVSVSVSNIISDTTPPIATLTAPASGTISGTTTLTATASDNVGVASVNFFYGTTLISSDTTAPYSATWNTTTVTNGTYQVKAIVSDTAGNTNTTQIVSVTVNNTAGPITAAIVFPSSGIYVYGTIGVTATAASTLPITKVEFYRDSVTTPFATTVSLYTAFLDTKTLSNGPHTLYVISYDSSGATGTSSPIQITVSNS